MVVVPKATPVIIPVLPMVAIAVLLLLHVPPDDASDAVSVPPIHKGCVEDMEIADSEFTVMVTDTLQLEPRE